MRRGCLLVLAMSAAVWSAARCEPAPLVTEGINGSSSSADRSLDLLGSDLKATSANASAVGLLNNPDLLSTALCDLSTNPAVVKPTATAASGSGVFFGSAEPGPKAGRAWEDRNAPDVDGAGAEYSPDHWLSSLELSLFDRTRCLDLTFPLSGLLSRESGVLDCNPASAGDLPTVGIGALGELHTGPVIHPRIVLPFEVDPAAFSLKEIDQIHFH